MQNKLKSNSSSILLLSTFIAPRKLDEYPLLTIDDWELILNENPPKVIQEFIKNGLIEKSSLYDILILYTNITTKQNILIPPF